MTTAPGRAFSHASSVAASRSGSTSTTCPDSTRPPRGRRPGPAQREVVYPGDRRRGGHQRVGQRHDQPKNREECTGTPRAPASRAPARPASSRPKPASMPSSGALRRRYRTDTPRPARRTSPSGTRAPRSGTGAPTARSAPAGRPPRHRPPPARTRHGPARTPPRTTGTAPALPGRTPGSPPRPRCPPPGRPAAREGAGTA